jgi:hypothetical protein
MFLYLFPGHESSVEQVLPASLLPSPTKSAGDNLSDFSTAMMEVNKNSAFSISHSSDEIILLLPSTFVIDKASQ